MKNSAFDENGQVTEEWIGSVEANMRSMNLAGSITSAFNDSSPVRLRQWYVETFVLDPYNIPLLPRLGTIRVLQTEHESSSWVTTEHAAIGTRLLFAVDPRTIAPDPDLLETDSFRNEDTVADLMIRLFRPWLKIRYDPETENWYQVISPGQWCRHGKGAPGQNVVEEWLKRWLRAMDPTDNPGAYSEWPIDQDKYPIEIMAARVTGSLSQFRKFKHLSTTKARIRQAFERNPIMWLDSGTVNQIRSLTPFANGALALVGSSYVDTARNKHVIEPGSLQRLDIEYMVSNANPLPWHDPENRIPRAATSSLTMEGDFIKLTELEDELLFGYCGTYWSFLTHAFPDPEERSAFLRLLGAAMYGTNIKIVAAMIGEPNAGKDTVMNWLSYLMPGQVATLPFSAFTPYGDDDRGFAPLRGARVATVSGEVGEGRGSKLLAEKIKTVSSGGGKIRVAEKYEKPTDIWFDGMLFLQGNSVPQIAGGDRALYTNRLVAVEFKHPFVLQAKSYEAMYRAEAPYFAQVLFLNYLQYQHEGGGMSGIAPPRGWRDFAKEFADSSNPHGFLESCIVKSDKPIPTQHFHQALSATIAKFGSPFPVGPNYWPKRLRTLGFPTKGPDSVRRQIGGNKMLCYMLDIDAEKSDGAFTQQQWSNILKDAAVTV